MASGDGRTIYSQTASEISLSILLKEVQHHGPKQTYGPLSFLGPLRPQLISAHRPPAGHSSARAMHVTAPAQPGRVGVWSVGLVQPDSFTNQISIIILVSQIKKSIIILTNSDSLLVLLQNYYYQHAKSTTIGMERERESICHRVVVTRTQCTIHSFFLRDTIHS